METMSRVAGQLTIRMWIATSLAILLLVGLSAKTGEPQSVTAVTIDWDGNKFKNLSGVGVVGKFLVVADDESEHAVHVLESRSSGYKYLDKVKLTSGDDELDLEGIACDKNIVYVIGSHSRNSDNERQKAREKVFRFELGPNGKKKGDVEETTLREVIVNHKILEPALLKKPKEGGIDIEGIAVHEDWLYAGFRGPLQGHNALVLKFRFETPVVKTAQFLAVDLGGFGIRDLTRVADGFLILAGPTDDAAGPYQLHHWDGQDRPTGKTRRLCTIQTKTGAKAEGLVVLREDKATYEFLILYDGPKGGDPKRFLLKK